MIMTALHANDPTKPHGWSFEYLLANGTAQCSCGHLLREHNHDGEAGIPCAVCDCQWFTPTQPPEETKT